MSAVYTGVMHGDFVCKHQSMAAAVFVFILSEYNENVILLMRQRQANTAGTLLPRIADVSHLGVPRHNAYWLVSGRQEHWHRYCPKKRHGNDIMPGIMRPESALQPHVAVEEGRTCGSAGGYGL